VTTTQTGQEAPVAEERLLELARPLERRNRDRLQVFREAGRELLDRVLRVVQAPELHAVDRKVGERGGLEELVLRAFRLGQHFPLELHRVLELVRRRVDARELL